jgi:hypothetical protein
LDQSRPRTLPRDIRADGFQAAMMAGVREEKGVDDGKAGAARMKRSATRVAEPHFADAHAGYTC